MPVSGEDRELPRLAVVARAFGLLVAQGASTGLFFWEIRTDCELAPYAVSNTLPLRCRDHAIGAMVAGVALAVIFGAILVLLRRARGADLLDRVARRCAPLCLAGLVPLLFNWRLWADRDAVFVCTAAIFGLALQGLMRVSLAAPSVFGIDVSRLLKQLPLALLRWRSLPLLISCLAGAFCAAYFGYFTVLNHYDLHTSAYNLGVETNLVWHAAHGGPLFRTTPLGGTMSLVGGRHAFFVYVMAPVFRLVPRPETLLVIQSLFMGASVVPLFLIARRRVGPWIACLSSCLLVLYPPFHGSVLYDFHTLPLSTFFLLTSLHLFEVRRSGWAALVTLLALSLHEDVGALLTVVGVYLVMTGRRPVAGMLLAAASLACFLAQLAFLNQRGQLFPGGGDGFGGLMSTLVGNPAFTLGGLVDSDKATYVLKIFAPLAFLPWRRPISMLLLLPGLFFTLLVPKQLAVLSISFPYTAYWTPFVFLAAIDALAWLREPRKGATRVGLSAWLVAATLSMFVCSYEYGAVLQHNTSKAGFDVFEFGKTSRDKIRHRDLYALIAQVPPSASVMATEHIIPHVASRANAFTVRLGPYDADHALLGFPLRDDEKRPLEDLLRSGKFGVVDVRGDFALVRRGYSPALNAALLSRIGG